MTIDDAALLAEQFLDNYLTTNEYFTPEEEIMESDEEDPKALRLCFIRTIPHTLVPLDIPANTIRYLFTYGRHFYKDDPELIELVEQCMNALKMAHPEIASFKSQISLDS